MRQQTKGNAFLFIGRAIILIVLIAVVVLAVRWVRPAKPGGESVESTPPPDALDSPPPTSGGLEDQLDQIPKGAASGR
jgi:hypothetical protein